MTTAEIQDVISGYRRQIDEYGYLIVYDSNWMTSVIETLLARDNIRTFAEQEARIAELESEMDELKRRLREVLECFAYEVNDDCCLYDRLLTIAEGRDNE